MISVFAATVATAALIVSGVGAQSQCNTVRNSQKQDCHLFSQSTCQAAGCCWVPVQPNPTNLPWCFRQATPFVFRPAYPGTRRPFEAALDLLRTNMLANVDIAGKGGVLASPDTNVYQGGSYYFAWMRDGGLSMRTILRTWPNATLAQQTFILDKMHSFVQWVVRVQNQPDPHNIDVRTEPKFNLPNGDVFTGSWCRPQTDGPAIRSTTLLLFAQHLLASGAVGRTYVQQYLWTGNNQALNGGIIAYDLDWVVDNWSSVPSCDLWEEIISSSIFWNLVHFKLAMQIGSEFASTMGDSARATKYAAEVAKIDAAIQQHWNGQFLYETTTNGRLVDSAVLGGLKIAFELHRDIEWPFGDPRSDQVAHTVHHYANAFFNAYSINQKLITTPGLLVGRYLGDTYGGGNPWILSTAQLASVLFEVAFDLRQNGTVSSTALATWNNVLDSSLQASDAKSLANSLISAGDGVMQRLDALVKSYSYQLSEQLDKASGVELSATNLTWSYAEVLNAVSIRARL